MRLAEDEELLARLKALEDLDDNYENAKAQLAEAREVIEFYGNRENYKGYNDCVLGDDDIEDQIAGKKARAYLEKYK